MENSKETTNKEKPKHKKKIEKKILLIVRIACSNCKICRIMNVYGTMPKKNEINITKTREYEEKRS